MAINELRSISIFVAAAELGSLRKTAAALNVSPQAASQALAQSSSTWACACSIAPRARWR